MRDEEQRHAAFPLQPGQQLQDLRLHGHVEGGGGFVGHQQLRFAGQGRGEHHALLHAAAQLVGVVPGANLGIRQPHLPQQIQRAPASRRAVQTMMVAQHLGHLLPHRQHGIQGGRRLLEDKAHGAAAVTAPLRLGQRQQILSPPQHPAAHPGRGRQQAQQGQGRHGLSAAGLPHQAEAGAGGQAEIEATHDRHRHAPHQELHHEILHGEQGFTAHAHLLRRLFADP
jgi:hypothetical protein